MKRLIVIGAGLGGLAAALRLARQGFRVTVLEKNERVGGKLDLWEDRGYSFDTGPTLLTMPFVLQDLFASAGRNLPDLLDIVPVDPLCRYFWKDGLRIDASSDRRAMERELQKAGDDAPAAYARFMEHAERIYRAGAGPFLFTPFMSLGPACLMRHLRDLGSVFRIDAFRTLDGAVGSFFHDRRLRQLFNRFATYNGSSPYLAPATLAIIPYVEFAMGGWYIRGGLYRLVEVIESLARESGAEIRTGVEVTSLLGTRSAAGVRTADGEEIQADAVICNADALYARERLIPGTNGGPRRASRAEPSLAGFVMLLGVRKTFPGLQHHNIFFSDDYRAEFDSLVGEGRPAENPTIYCSLSSLTDPARAPKGCSNLFVLVNAPALGPAYDWTKGAAAYRARVLSRLREFGVSVDADDIETEKVITPIDFARRYNAYRGSIYGTSSNGRMAAFVRPPNRAREMRNLYFAGGSAHPGGGIPLVLLSGKLVADLIMEQHA